MPEFHELIGRVHTSIAVDSLTISQRMYSGNLCRYRYELKTVCSVTYRQIGTFFTSNMLVYCAYVLKLFGIGISFCDQWFGKLVSDVF